MSHCKCNPAPGHAAWCPQDEIDRLRVELEAAHRRLSATDDSGRHSAGDIGQAWNDAIDACQTLLRDSAVTQVEANRYDVVISKRQPPLEYISLEYIEHHPECTMPRQPPMTFCLDCECIRSDEDRLGMVPR